MGLHLVPQEMPEAKAGKNRAHLGVEVTDLDVSLERVAAIGGNLVECIKNTNGEPLLVCAGPETTSSVARLPDEGDGLSAGKPQELPHVWDHHRALLERRRVVVTAQRHECSVRRERR